LTFYISMEMIINKKDIAINIFSINLALCYFLFRGKFEYGLSFGLSRNISKYNKDRHENFLSSRR